MITIRMTQVSTEEDVGWVEYTNTRRLMCQRSYLFAANLVVFPSSLQLTITKRRKKMRNGVRSKSASGNEIKHSNVNVKQPKRPKLRSNCERESQTDWSEGSRDE